jgi:hypothetical protein
VLLHRRGLLRRLVRRGHRTGEFLTADPNGGDRDEQGEERDGGRGEEPAGEEPGGQGVRG